MRAANMPSTNVQCTLSIEHGMLDTNLPPPPPFEISPPLKPPPPRDTSPGQPTLE